MTPAVLTAPVCPAPAAAEGELRIRSAVLGEISVLPSQIFHFPEGVFGFPESRRFALLPTARTDVYWLQSIEHEALAFLLVDPFRFVEGYSVELGPLELAGLHPVAASDLVVFCVLTLPGEGRPSGTINLQGPIALNLERAMGRQVVLAAPGLGTRHPVDLRARVAAG